jgi:hypothetical protein
MGPLKECYSEEVQMMMMMMMIRATGKPITHFDISKL